MKNGRDLETGLISLLPAHEDGPAPHHRERAPVPVPMGATDVRVEDLGNGRARVVLDLPWAVALLVLNELAQAPERSAH